MSDKTKTKSQLIREINELRQRVAELEGSASNTTSLEQDLGRSILDVYPAFLVMIDAQGKTKMMNKSMLNALDYSESEAQGKDYLSTFVVERDRDQVSALFEQLLQGKSTTNQNHVLAKDGHELLVEWHGYPLLDSKDRVEYFFGIGLDITERQKAEEAYRVLVEGSLQALIIIQDKRIVFANPAAEALTGYSIDELLSMEDARQSLLHPDDLPGVLERNAQRARGETIPPNSIFRVVQKDGQVRWMDGYITAIELSGKPATHIVFIDITERKQAEDDLQRISNDENKRRMELEKLREISATMRQANGSTNFLNVFTREVMELSEADLVSSVIFKEPESLVIFTAPDQMTPLSQEFSDTVISTLHSAQTNLPPENISGYNSMIVLPLQSAESLHGAFMVAYIQKDAITLDKLNMFNAIADMAGTALQRIDILETLEKRVQQRTHDLVVLYNLITIISENWRLQDLLELSLVLTLETIKADRGIIYMTDGKESPDLKPVIQRGFANGFQVEVDSLPDNEIAREVYKKHRPMALENVRDIPAFTKFKDINSYAGIPILVRGEVRGVFSLFAKEKGVFGTDEMALLASIADHLGIGIENSILFEQSRESAALEERNRLARNLHDSVSQLIYSLTLMAGSTKKMLERNYDRDAIKVSVERLGDTAYQALKEMRLLLYELRPAVLESEGLVSALQHRIDTVEERLGVKVDLQADRVPELPSDMEDAFYHIALEALNNIVKHSESSKALIKLADEEGVIKMEIIDTGQGFDTNQIQGGQGLQNMRERIQLLGGEFSVVSTPGQGTCITAQIRFPSATLEKS